MKKWIYVPLMFILAIAYTASYHEMKKEINRTPSSIKNEESKLIRLKKCILDG